MAHHETLFTGVLVVKAFGKDRFNQLMLDSATDIVAGQIPLRAGVTYESDPGGGGPYDTVVLRKFQFDFSARNAPGYPGNDDD